MLLLIFLRDYLESICRAQRVSFMGSFPEVRCISFLVTFAVTLGRRSCCRVESCHQEQRNGIEESVG
jgi:hypothetical protein